MYIARSLHEHIPRTPLPNSCAVLDIDQIEKLQHDGFLDTWTGVGERLRPAAAKCLSFYDFCVPRDAA